MGATEALAGFVLVLLLLTFGPTLSIHLLVRLGDRAHRRGDLRRSLALARRLSRMAITTAYRAHLWDLEVNILQYLGYTRSALDQIPTRPIIDARTNARTLGHVNTLINGGQYRRALDLGVVCVAEGVAPITPAEHALLAINLAEALYNLGRWEDAWKRMEGIDGFCDPVGLAGGGAQRAWILAHTGRAEAARALLERVDEGGLPLIFKAEYHFTRAAVLAGLARWDEATAACSEGQRLAKRASSERNALFLFGRIAFLRGDFEAALPHFARGARHRYKGQGGGGLLCWGEALDRLGRNAEARDAWALSVKRDLESEAAAIARRRLAGEPAPATLPP